MKNWGGEGSKDAEEDGVSPDPPGIPPPASVARLELLIDRFDCSTYRELNAFLRSTSTGIHPSVQDRRICNLEGLTWCCCITEYWYVLYAYMDMECKLRLALFVTMAQRRTDQRMMDQR